jgi:hypothetical protein
VSGLPACSAHTRTHARTHHPHAAHHQRNQQTLGNHEFDNGPRALGSFIGNLTFPMLGACNTDTSREPSLDGNLRRFAVLTHQAFKVRTLGCGVCGVLCQLHDALHAVCVVLRQASTPPPQCAQGLRAAASHARCSHTRAH